MADERTFVMIKPDGVQRGLVGQIIARFEQKGYSLAGLKMVRVDKSFAEKHYSDLSSKPFFGGLTSFLSSGPVVAMCWQGKDAVKTGRKLIGATNPLESSPGTIRGDYCVSSSIRGDNVLQDDNAMDQHCRSILGATSFTAPTLSIRRRKSWHSGSKGRNWSTIRLLATSTSTKNELGDSRQHFKCLYTVKHATRLLVQHIWIRAQRSHAA